MNRSHVLSLVVSLTLLANCNANDDPMALVPGSAASSVTDDASFSAASLTLPYSGSYSGLPPAFSITQTGLGRAGYFENSSASNPRTALTALTSGSSFAFYARSAGNGNTAYFENTKSGSTASVLYLRSSGTGTLVEAASTGGVAVRGTTTGSSSAGYFATNNQANGSGTIHTQTNGVGAAITAANLGSGRAALMYSHNTTNQVPVLEATMHGTGSVGLFRIINPSNVAEALRTETEGTGVALVANQSGSSGSIAVFQADEVNQARIDRNGTGFFNGGTQTGGADVAEAFEVEGAVSAYRPGDVLVISTRNDQRVARSSDAYSTRVIGVYATKPGVLLTERSVDDALADMIPVGVVGIVPTRVSAENGPVRRGDILVTARTPGHAMRATPLEVNGVKLYPSGAILGKALQNFAGPGTGMIKVLVNVK